MDQDRYVCGSFWKTGIFGVLLPTNSSKQRKENQCLARYRWMMSSECVSRYCVLFTTETKELCNLFFSSAWWITTFHLIFLMLVWWHESIYEINYSHFFRGGWRGVLKWCNVRAHKRTISASTIDFRPILTYESTSADLRQQRLTPFRAVCGVLFDYKRESTVVFSGVRDVTLMTHICSQSAECLYATFCNQTWYSGAPP